MGYLPIFLDVAGRQCVVIGGGPSAEVRIRALVDAGAIVTVVSSERAAGISAGDEQGRVRRLSRDYQYGDLRGSSLVYITVRDAELVNRAAAEAEELGTPLNVVDHPEASTFISPASFMRGELQIAISTGGASPSVARMIRQQLEQQFGPEYAMLLKVLRATRQFLRSRRSDPAERSRILQSLAADLLNSVRRLDYALVEQKLQVHLDAGITELGLEAELQDKTMTENGRRQPHHNS